MKTYHYTECGLNNVYLTNGFKITKTDDGEEIFIHDIHGLHNAIAKTLIFKQGLLMGDEIKFIRIHLDLSQKKFGQLLGVDYQTILAWEKNKSNIPKTANHLLKIILYSYLNKKIDCTIYDKINEIADLDASINKNNEIKFKEVKDEWKLVA